jgi:hypothetical protein
MEAGPFSGGRVCETWALEVAGIPVSRRKSTPQTFGNAFSTGFPWASGPPEGMKIPTLVAPAKAGVHVAGFPLARE